MASISGAWLPTQFEKVQGCWSTGPSGAVRSLTGAAIGLGVLCFSLGAWSSQLRIEAQIANNDAHIAQLRDQLAWTVLEARRARMPRAVGTDGEMTSAAAMNTNESRIDPGGRDQAAAPERNGPSPYSHGARTAQELRGGQRLRPVREDEIQHCRVSWRRLLHYREARRDGAQ